MRAAISLTGEVAVFFERCDYLEPQIRFMHGMSIYLISARLPSSIS